MDHFGLLIKSLREKENLTQQDFANHLNVTRATISRWENNNSLPDAKMLRDIAELLHVSCDELVHPTETLEKMKQPVTESFTDEPKEQIPTKPRFRKKRIAIFCVILILLVIMALWYQFDLRQFRLIETHTNVETEYGPAYELVYCHKLKSSTHDFITHADSVQTSWKNGMYTDSTEKVLIISYYLSENDINNWENTYFQMFFFE